MPKAASPKMGRWIARPQKPRWALRLGAAVGFVWQLPNLLQSILRPWLGNAAWIAMFGAFALMGGGFLLYFWRECRARRLQTRDLALVDGGFGDQFPVEMTIVVKGKHLGVDRGVVWFDDGLIGFSGSAASFVVASCDIEPKRQGQNTPRTGRGYPDGAIALVNAPYEAYVIVQPLGRDGKAYRERLQRFNWEPVNREAERHWPPLVSYEEAERTERMVRDALEEITG